MAQASLIEPRVRKLHQIMTETGWTGLKMPRDLFETAIALHVSDINSERVRRYVVLGESLGLWRRSERSRVLRILPSRSEEAPDSIPVLA
jgi:hypothetical protein